MLMVTRRVIKPLHNMRDAMLKVAAGDLAVDTGYADRGDEIGRMAETLEMLRQTAMTARALEAEQIAAKQQGENEKREALIALANRFDASVGRLVGMMASGSTELESCSVLIDVAHDVCGFCRWVSVAFAPVTTELYAGVNVYHCCPSPPIEKCGRKKYG